MHIYNSLNISLTSWKIVVDSLGSSRALICFRKKSHKSLRRATPTLMFGPIKRDPTRGLREGEGSKLKRNYFLPSCGAFPRVTLRRDLALGQWRSMGVVVVVLHSINVVVVVVV